MKKLSVITLKFCKANFLFSLAFAGALLFAGCSKETPAPANSTTTASDVISNNDVTQAVTNAVSASSSGLATQTETTAQITAESSLACGQTIDSSISGVSPSGAIFAYNYDLNFSRTCICTGGVPTQYNTTITGSSSYSVILMSSNDSTNAHFSVSGIQSAATNYVLNGTYVRTGTIQSLISNQHTFNGTITFTSTNITVSKSTKQIISGTAAIQFNGTTLSGNTTSQTATITFLGNNQASLIVGNGSPTTINW